MARDIFVYWPKGEAGSDAHEMGKELEAYFANGMARVSLAQGEARWLADLHGKPEVREGMPPESANESRWIEVYVAADYADIITRDQDDVTNAIARGFAERIARKWKGRLET